MSNSSESIFNLGTFQVTCAAGASIATLIGGQSFFGPGVNSINIKPLTGGGSMIIIGFPGYQGPGSEYGATLTSAQLGAAVAAGQYWPLDAALSIDGPGRFYLAALGTTATAAIIAGRTGGT